MMLPTYLPRREWDAIACATSLLTLSMRRKSAHQMTNYAANRRRKRKGTMTSRGYVRPFLRRRLWRPGTFCKACRISDRTLKPHLEKKTSDVGKRKKSPVSSFSADYVSHFETLRCFLLCHRTSITLHSASSCCMITAVAPLKMPRAKNATEFF